MKTFLTKLLILGLVVTLPAKVQLYLEKNHIEEQTLDKSLLDGVFSSPFTAHPERNNPFDIIYSSGSEKFIGCIGQNAGFCVFDTKEHGSRAGMILVFGYIKKGFNTIEKFIKRYSATDQESYINFICINMGLTKDEEIPMTNDELCLLGHLITVFEGQYGKEGISVDDLKKVLSTGARGNTAIDINTFSLYDYLKQGEYTIKYYLIKSELSEYYFPPINTNRDSDE